MTTWDENRKNREKVAKAIRETPYVETKVPPGASARTGEFLWKKPPNLDLVVSNLGRVIYREPRTLSHKWIDAYRKVKFGRLTVVMLPSGGCITELQLFGLAFLPPCPYPDARSRLIDTKQGLSISNLSWDIIEPIPNELWGKVTSDHSASHLGRLRNNLTGRHLYRKPVPYGVPNLKTPDGPLGVPLHILVARLFVPNDDPARKTIVNHKDGDPTNSAASNLEWTSSKGNSGHASTAGLLQGRPVVRTDAHGDQTLFPSIAKAADHDRNKSTYIGRAIRSKRAWGGFKWAYQNPRVTTPEPDPLPTPGEVFLPLPPDESFPEFEDITVSTSGTVMNEQGRILKASEVKHKKMLRVYVKGISHSVAQLVARAHLGKPPIEDAVVGHHDGNFRNNCATNLFWKNHRSKWANRKRKLPSVSLPVERRIKH